MGWDPGSGKSLSPIRIRNTGSDLLRQDTAEFFFWPNPGRHKVKEKNEEISWFELRRGGCFIWGPLEASYGT
jgi:hypothetical protein